MPSLLCWYSGFEAIGRGLIKEGDQRVVRPPPSPDYHFAGPHIQFGRSSVS